jgi:hypothetical protein
MQDLKAAGFINKVGKDPWDNDYNFKCPGEKNAGGVDVWSAGPDATEGNEDDIDNFADAGKEDG